MNARRFWRLLDRASAPGFRLAIVGMEALGGSRIAVFLLEARRRIRRRAPHLETST